VVKEKKVMVGGQAVLEGVMMRGPERVAVAVRKADGSIAVRLEPFESITKRIKILAWPFLRGGVMLIESLMLGVRALSFSGDVAMIDEKTKESVPSSQKGIWEKIWMAATVFFSFAVGLALFFYVPLLLTGLFHFQSGLAFNLVDGVFRLIFFLTYIYLISLWKEIRCVFQYHGAEHKSVYAFEAQQELTIASARPFSTLHPRCGTSFLMIVMVVSILVFMFLGKPDTLIERLIRIAFVPVIGGISYEFIRLSEKAGQNPFTRLFILPGLWLQKITTKEPDDSQIEVALVALRCALKMDPAVGISRVEIAQETISQRVRLYR
jgi:uncharacterized protein YqhQ